MIDSTRTCPGLHGLAGNETGAMYGCANGVLHVGVASGRAVFTSFNRADDARFRVGTVWAREGQPRFLVRTTITGAPVSSATARSVRTW